MHFVRGYRLLGLRKCVTSLNIVDEKNCTEGSTHSVFYFEMADD